MAQIQSGASSDLLTIEPGSKAARAALYDDIGNPLSTGINDKPADPHGFISIALNDGRAVPNRADRFGSLATASHTTLLAESFEGTTINLIRWNPIATTMASTQSSVAGLTLNSGNITTINTGYFLKSSRSILKTQRSPLHTKMRARLDRVNNSVMELGFGDATTFNGIHTTGAYWQVTSGGVVQPVLTFNSVDITGDNITGLLNTTDYFTFDVVVDDDSAIFYVQNTSTGIILSRQTIPLPVTAQRLFSASASYAFARLYNTGTAPASAPHLFLTDVYVAGLDVNHNKPWSHVMASIDRGHTSQVFSGAQLAQWANSAAPANATLSNTAAGYATLGGLFSFAAVAGAVTDYALFGFQVPVPANLIITGVDIDVWNTGAAVATTPTVLAWALGVGSTAVSLATATVMRRGLGVQALPVATPIGGTAQRLSKQFDTPLNVSAGRFLHLILRMPVGTATASQVIQGMANFEGYFD